MKKNKLFYGLVSLTGGLTIIGSAFCAWSFGTLPEATSQRELSLEITNVINGVGTIETQTREVILRLDQGGIYDVNDVNYSNVGISLINNSNQTIEASFLNGTYKVSSDEYNTSIKNNNDFLLRTTITIPSEYTKYITINTETSKFIEAEGGNGTIFTRDYTTFTSDNKDYYVFMYVDGSTIDGVNQLFKWVNKPTTLDEYNTMKTDLENAGKITISYRASFSE